MLRIACAGALLWLAGLGCPPDPPRGSRLPTPGQLGQARFGYVLHPMPLAWARGLDEFALAAGGATATALAWAPEGWYAVASTNERVAHFSAPSALYEDAIDITTGDPGEADLVLLGPRGEVIDRATFTVREVALLSVHNGATGRASAGRWEGAPLQVAAGVPVSLLADKLDAAGRQLLGDGITSHRLEGVLRPDPQKDTCAALAFGSWDCWEDPLDAVGFAGDAGDGAVELLAGRAGLRVPVRVVLPEHIESVRIEPETITIREYPHGRTWLRAATAEGPVFGERCDWTVSDPRLSFSGAARVARKIPLWLEPRSYEFADIPGDSGPGEISAVCRIGRGSAAVTVRVER